MNIGCHLSKQYGLQNCINIIKQYGGDAFQFCISPPQSSAKGRPISNPNEILKAKRDSQIYWVVHGKYTLNFCHPRNAKYMWQFDALIYDLKQADQIEADVVIHQGKNVYDGEKLTNEQAIQRYTDNIKWIIKETPDLQNKIILENSCKQGTECGYTVEELAEIFSKFNSQEKERIGFCLDTCHIFVAGTMDVRSVESINETFDQFDKLIGLEHLCVIHLNDSETPFDKHTDRHADLLTGFIGNSELGGNPEGFKHFVKKAHSLGIPMILETSGEIPHQDQISLLRSWIENDLEYREEYLSTHLEKIQSVTKKLQSVKSKK